MELLKNISHKLQIINEVFGKIKSDHDLRDYEQELWKQGQNKDLESETDNNGTFKVNFNG